MELAISVSVVPTDRHRGQPLTRERVERCVAIRERLEIALAQALADLEPMTDIRV